MVLLDLDVDAFDVDPDVDAFDGDVEVAPIVDLARCCSLQGRPREDLTRRVQTGHMGDTCQGGRRGGRVRTRGVEVDDGLNVYVAVQSVEVAVDAHVEVNVNPRRERPAITPS
ncbi:MAG: hypothetical protein NT062_20485 [Proteobacteria bacterium]|nr:hypothetical protein [Pseudomonadota bacterium]